MSRGPEVWLEWAVSLDGVSDGYVCSETEARRITAKHGACLRRRTVTTTYGEWESVPELGGAR